MGSEVLIAMGFVGSLGAAFGFGLAIASKVFHVDVDPRIAAIIDILPGANCGACGFPGCTGFADAVVRGEADPIACTPGGPDCCAHIARILGVEIGTAEATPTAICHCAGTRQRCVEEAVYVGIPTCKSAQLIAGGVKKCIYGCLGLADCVKACPFDALELGPDGIPYVDEDKCTACKNCIAACPRDLFTLEPRAQQTFVRCMNKQKGALTGKACKIGCIGCRKCVKACPFDAATVVDNCAVIDAEKCRNCGACAKVCPKKTIEDAVTERPVAYIQDTCSKSGKCQEACPFDAVEGEKEDRRMVNPVKCVGCEACVDVCPTKSIVMRKQ